MDSVCRLCCSTKFVNNYLFDEESALNLKMELFLPIKVMKGDELPQKVCNQCSCKVNDIYQFCNFAIETQDRLRGMLLQVNQNFHQSVDLTLTKQESLLPVPLEQLKVNQETQTEDLNRFPDSVFNSTSNLQLKEEHVSISPSIIKRESSVEYDAPIPSDDSDDLSLIVLKNKKKSQKINTNGELRMKRNKKKKSKLGAVDITQTDLACLVEKLKDDVKNQSEKPGCKPVSLDGKSLKKELEDVEMFQCCICFNLFYLRSDMLQHYRRHVDELEEREPPPAPPLVDQRCPRCRKSVEAGAWAAHWARHWQRDRRPYRCALCEKTFRNPHQILKHGQTHKPGEPEPAMKKFVCDLCPEGFVFMRYLVSHRARCHPEAAHRALSLRCAQCSRAFAHLNSLRRHLRAHSGERNFLCSVCGKALSSREHLKFHLRIHTGYKPNVCKTCGKGFVKKCNLTLHERVHSGEKPHVCSHCGKAFSQRSTLVIHERYHSGARPYVCSLCGRGFVAKGLLSMHLKTTCI